MLFALKGNVDGDLCVVKVKILVAHVDFVICNDHGKNKMGTEADHIKQSCWAEAEAAEEGKIISATELSGNHRNRMYCLYCLSQNENSVEKPTNKYIRAKYC